jgi:hypothetical protein
LPNYLSGNEQRLARCSIFGGKASQYRPKCGVYGPNLKNTGRNTGFTG